MVNFDEFTVGFFSFAKVGVLLFLVMRLDDMCCWLCCVRILSTIFLKKTSLLASLGLLKSRGGLMPVLNS